MPIDLSEAVQHHRRGNLDRAAAAYRDALAEDPNDAQALHLLGMISLQTGNPAAALPLIEQAVALKPGEPDYLAALAEVRNGLRQIEAAVELYRRALALRRDRADWWSNLGASLVELGRADEAIEAFTNALQTDHHLAPAHHNLAHLYHAKGEIGLAEIFLKNAIQLAPNSAESRALLAKVLAERGDLAKALEQAAQAAALRPNVAEYFLTLGNILAEMGQFDDAGIAYREAVKLQPKSASAHAALGGFLEQTGAMEESLAAFREALRHDPDHPGALAKLAKRLKKSLPEEDRNRIERKVDDPRVPARDRIALAFGLVAVQDAIGRYDQATSTARKAHALRSAEFKNRGKIHDPDEHAAYMERIKNAFREAWFERTRGWGSKSRKPVFVVGLPRSGTTLIEQILSSRPDVVSVGECSAINDLFMAITGRGLQVEEGLSRLDPNFAAAAAGEYEAVQDRAGAAASRVVDKMPENANALGLIATFFPEAKIIECKRDPRDIALSCLLTDLAKVRWSCDVHHVAARIESHLDLMRHWHAVLPRPILSVEYESVVADLEGQARRLMEFCELEWDPRCLDFHENRRPVLTASAAQVRSPIYSSSVGRWRHYREFLAPVIRKLDLTD